jgi:hypothetical protein
VSLYASDPRLMDSGGVSVKVCASSDARDFERKVSDALIRAEEDGQMLVSATFEVASDGDVFLLVAFLVLTFVDDDPAEEVAE